MPQTMEIDVIVTNITFNEFHTFQVVYLLTVFYPVHKFQPRPYVVDSAHFHIYQSLP